VKPLKLNVATILGTSTLILGCAVSMGCTTSYPAGITSAENAAARACPIHLARLREGELAPDFVARGRDDSRVALSALRSRTVVLHFFPAGTSLSASQELGKLREAWPGVSEQGVVLIGVSRGKAPGVERSATSGPFRLVDDTSGFLSRAYGWADPSHDADRRTFVIGPDGAIEKVYCVPGS
jgi:peroxiredoxin Q/BCP